MSNKYITTTLPYVNADPHIGFAVEIIQADTLARFWRLQGHDVFFNTGTDEHGQKILEAAEKNKEDVQTYADKYAVEFQKLPQALNISNNAFVRTTDENHKKAAQEMWRRCEERGDIYKKEYEGLYCVGCERFVMEKDLVDGKCSEHGVEPTLLKEENYFFKFSNYEKPLLKYLEAKEVIVPEWRREEAINFVKGGLEDFSISREKERLSWGIPVPGDDTQVMYVWFDALTSYISTLGWPDDTEGTFKTFWEESPTLQVAGKDQVRFQSLMFQAMLMSADIKNTDQIFYHGFINSDGQKMSKSIGNVINPYELVEKYGTDATRYLLLRHVHPVEDTDVTWERLDEWYTANLVNGIGNLTSRIMKLAETHLTDSDKKEFNLVTPEYHNFLEKFEFNSALNNVFEWTAKLDETITETEPFKVIKTDSKRGTELILDLIANLYSIGFMLKPFMPDTSKIIMESIEQHKKPENLFPRLES